VGPSSADVIARAQRSMSAIVHSPPQNLPSATADAPPPHRVVHSTRTTSPVC
jgi:hypothetical protein